MQNKYKTIIVGAGPGGLECARTLAENNENFILLERKPKFDRKICTGIWGLTQKAKDIKLPQNIIDRKFYEVVVSMKSKKVRLKQKNPIAATIDRKKLSEWMYERAKKSGANIIFNSPVSQIGKNHIVAKGRKFFFDYLVGADGSASTVRRGLGLSQHNLVGIQYLVKKQVKDFEIHLNPAKYGAWYCWTAPHQEYVSVGAGGDARLIPINEIKKNLKEWCIKNNFDVSKSKLEGAPICHDYQGHKFGNIFLVGDAGGFASKLTGGGMFYAMATGKDIARMIIDKNYKPESIEQILAIKKKHKLIADFISSNKTLGNLGYDLLLVLLKFNFMKKYFIELFA